MIEFLRDGDTRWITTQLSAGAHTDGEITVVLSRPMSVREKMRWEFQHRRWVTVQYDWDSATPIPSDWERLRDWLTHPVRAGEPRAVARSRWVLR